MKVAVIDSGLGGLDILSKVITKYPNHHYVYIGDNLNCPYGVKDGTTINTLTNNILKYLKAIEVDLIIVACNTMSAYLEVPIDFHIPIYKILDYNVEIIKSLKLEKISIIATAATIRSEIYTSLLENIDIKYVNGSLLTKLIEDNAAKEVIENEIRILNKLCYSDSEAIILGCTHYGLYKNYFMSRDIQRLIVEGGKNLICALPLQENMIKQKIFVCLTKQNKQYEERIKEILNNLAFSIHIIKLA